MFRLLLIVFFAVMTGVTFMMAITTAKGFAIFLAVVFSMITTAAAMHFAREQNLSGF